MDNLKINEILIFRSDPLFFEIVEERIECDLNKVNWTDLDKIGNALVEIINSTGAKAGAIPYFSIPKENLGFVGKKISISNMETNLDLTQITSLFLHEITKIDTTSGDLFDDDSSPFAQNIKEVANIFLSESGNKPIKHKMDIQTANSTTKIAGKFRQYDNSKNTDEPEETHTAVVIGIIKNKRIVHLKLSSQKIIVAFFNQNDFLILHQLLMSDEPCLLEIQKKIDAGGKKDTYLISVEKIQHTELILSS